MANPTNSNGVDNGESTLSAEQIQSKDQQIEKTIGKVVAQDVDDSSFIEGLPSSLTEGHFRKGMELLLDTSEKQHFESDFQKYFLDYTNRMKKHTLKITDLRMNAYKLFCDRYSMDTSQKAKIDRSLKPLKQKDLEGLITSDVKVRSEFLQTIFGADSVPELQTKFRKEELYRKISALPLDSESVKSRIRAKLKENDTFDQVLNEISAMLDDLKRARHIDMSVLQDLFAYDIFTLEEKREFLRLCIPFVSLADLREVQMLDDTSIEKILQNKIAQHGESNSDEQKILIGNMKNELDDIFLSIDEVFKLLGDDSSVIDKFGSEYVFSHQVVKSYNVLIDSAKNNLFTSIETPDIFFTKIKEDDIIKQKISPDAEKKFLPGATLLIKTKDKTTGSIQIEYIELVSLGTDGSFYYRDRSAGLAHPGKYMLGTKPLSQKSYYSQLLTAFSQIDIDSIELLSPNELQTRIRSGDIETMASEVKFKTKSEFDEYKSDVLPGKKVQLETLSTGKTAEQIAVDPAIQSLKREIELLEDGYESFSFEYFKQKLDELDTVGKQYGLKEGVVFQVNNPSDPLNGKIFTLVHINEKGRTIQIVNAIGEKEEGSFEDFYALCKAKNLVRVADPISFEGFPKELAQEGEIGNVWSKFEVDGNEIRKKEGKWKGEYEFLVQKDGEKLIKIHDVRGSGPNAMVKLSFGKLRTETVKGKKGTQDSKRDIYGVEDKPYEVTLGFLLNYIKSHKLTPQSLSKGAQQNEGQAEEETRKGAKMKWGFWSAIGSLRSFSEIAQGIKVGSDSILSYLKEGNEEHAAMTALQLYGKFLPQELKNDLRTRVEQSQKKRRDDYINNLSAVDSPIATGMIKKRITTSNAKAYKVEAGMLFMLGKYGTLYAKELASESGTFLWYRALGGTVGDSLYENMKAEAASLDIPFCEEKLVHILLKRQCKNNTRSSRLHKEYEAARKKGIAEEMEKGKKDAKSHRDIRGRIKEAIGELSGNTYPNSMGWFEGIVSKGGSMAEMNTVPFVILHSGVAEGFSQNTIDAFKDSMNHGRIIPAARFISRSSDIKLFQKTIVELSKRIGERYGSTHPQYKNIYSDALKLEENRGKLSSPKMIQQTLSFYEKYGEILTRAMYKLNTGTNDEFNYVEKMLDLEQDKNSLFKQYNDLFVAYINQDANFKVEEYMTDGLKLKGTSGMYLYKFVRDTLAYRTGGGFHQANIGPDALLEVEREFLAIPQRTYDTDPVKDKEIKGNILKHSLRELIAGILTSHSGDFRAIESINKGGSHFSVLFDRFGIQLTDFPGSNLNDRQVLDKDPRSEALIEQYVRNGLERADNGNLRKAEADSEVPKNVEGILSQGKSNVSPSSQYNREVKTGVPKSVEKILSQEHNPLVPLSQRKEQVKDTTMTDSSIDE